jgi:hypothetical protein
MECEIALISIGVDRDHEAGAAAHHQPTGDAPEAIETTRLPRVASRTSACPALVTTRPCRVPYQTIVDVGLAGGQVPTPGEVSVAHHGLLSLDALPECRRRVLEVLRQPRDAGGTHKTCKNVPAISGKARPCLVSIALRNQKAISHLRSNRHFPPPDVVLRSP